MLSRFKASDHTQLNYYDSGHGRLVLFQHGFTMDHRQVLEIWPALPGVRLVCLDTRGHGLSDLGEPNAVSFQRAVRDAVELTTHLGEAPSIVGGISLGAALALELTKHLHIEHLIMSRPAFSADGDTSNFAVFRALREIFKTQPKERWATSLEQLDEFQKLAATAPRNQETYRRLLDHPRLDDLMVWMDALEAEAITLSVTELGQLRCRTDIIGQEQDALHPARLAESLVQQIPDAKIHYAESGLASDDEYLESMRSVLKTILTYLLPPPREWS